MRPLSVRVQTGMSRLEAEHDDAGGALADARLLEHDRRRRRCRHERSPSSTNESTRAVDDVVLVRLRRDVDAAASGRIGVLGARRDARARRRSRRECAAVQARGDSFACHGSSRARSLSLSLLGDALFEVVDVLPAVLEAGVGEDALLQRHVGLDAFDDHLATARCACARSRSRGRGRARSACRSSNRSSAECGSRRRGAYPRARRGRPARRSASPCRGAA